MDAARDPVLPSLDSLIQSHGAVAALGEIVVRVRHQLEASDRSMAWEVVPLSVFGTARADSVRSCWIFVIRGDASTGAERHPNSHQRSYSLLGSGTFDVNDGHEWRPHPLTSGADDGIDRRWMTIPPSTWHRLRVGPEPWAMVSFHTVAAADLIEENPRDPERLDGPTRQERYVGRR